MLNYIAFIYGKVTSRSKNAGKDGEALAKQCINELEGLNKPGNLIDELDYFPPRLLILLTSPSYSNQSDAQSLIEGIQEQFVKKCEKKIPLIGSSVSAVFFDGKVYEKGALLICLTSRFIDAKVAVGKNVSFNHHNSINDLLSKLKLDDGEDLNPKTNKLLLTFFPFFQKSNTSPYNYYASDELHKYLKQKIMHRIPIAGGVSAFNGLQFSDGPSYGIEDAVVNRDAVVAALIETGVPLGGTFCRGLEKVDVEKMEVKNISPDRKFLELDEKCLNEIFESESGYLLFSDGSEERDLIIGVSEPAHTRAIKIVDKVDKGDLLTVMKPQPQMILQMAKKALEHTKKRNRIENPLACLMFACSSHYGKRELIGLDIEQAITIIEKKFGGPCVGGFLDGEAGIDETGRSQFGNWSTAGLYFGDELRDRTPLYAGFQAIADYDTRLSQADSLNKVIEESLRLVFNTGFPGAAISISQLEYRNRFLVSKQAIGHRFDKFPNDMYVPMDGYHTLAIAAKSEDPNFIPYSSEYHNFSKEKEANSSYSQYIIPLRNFRKDIIGVLQIDLGNKTKLHDIETEVMDSIGATISAGLTHFLDMEEIRIGRELDEALTKSLAMDNVKDGLQNFIEKVVEIFRVKWGHVRIEKSVELNGRKEHILELIAGLGEYYDFAKEKRGDIYVDDGTPTAMTYQRREPIIINNAQKNKPHQQLIKNNEESSEILKRVGSYANTPIKNEEGKTIGTINIVSHDPWFFTIMHEKAIKALGERTGILFQHLEQKQQSNENWKRIKFFHRISPQLEEIQYIVKHQAIIYEAVKKFSEAINAQVASLFLWDKTIEKYVLETQIGWAEKNKWIKAAKYEKGEGWTGNVALQETAVRVPKISELKAERFYKEQKFGDLSKKEYEAIALPLKAGGESVGVLTFYRKSKGEGQSDFTIVENEDLQTAADQLAALIKALLIYKDNVRQHSVQPLLNQIHDEIFLINHESLDQLTRDICRKLKTFAGAAQVDFYNLTEDKDKQRLVAKKDEILTKFLLDPYNPVIERYKFNSDKNRYDIEESKREGYIYRVCIPVIQQNKTVGIIDITWNTKQGPSPNEYFIFHTHENLLTLGRTIGSAYGRSKLYFEREDARRQSDRRKAAIQTMGAMVSQSAHRFIGLLSDLITIPDEYKRSKSESQRLETIEQLDESLKKGEEIVKRPLETASKIIDFNPIPYSLESLINTVLSEVCKEFEQKKQIETIVKIPEEMIVNVDPECMNVAFFNIIHNAFKMMVKVKGDKLIIKAESNNQEKHIDIIFEDNGPGMTIEDADKAINGFFNTQGRKGLGLLIASTLISVHDGSLKLEPILGEGVKAIVKLPLINEEIEK
jgi:signal transduction histidine kinase/transcriptional regulator with GAF, ATPase, and Fis domain